MCIKCSLAQLKSLSSPDPPSAVCFVLMPTDVRDPCVPDCRTGTQGFARIQHCYHIFGFDGLFSSSVTPVLPAVE